MSTNLREALREQFDRWRDDIDPRWQNVLADVQPDFAGVAADLDLADNEVVFPGRKHQPPAGARADSYVFGALKESRPMMQALGDSPDQGFTLVLDNEYDEAEASPMTDAPTAAALLAAGPVVLPKSIELDGLEVSSGSYWDRVENQKNLSQQLKEELRNAYP